METALRVNIDILLFQFVILLYANLRSRSERKNLDYRIFVLMAFVIVIELVTDAALLLSTGSPSWLGQAVLRGAAVVFYAFRPFSTMLYAIYVEYVTRSGRRRKPWTIAFYLLPGLSMAVMSPVSIATGWFYLFDVHGGYSSGPWSYLPTIVAYGYFACGGIVVLKRRRIINSREFARLISFPVPIVFCGALQILFPRFVFLLPADVMSLLILYANIQERRLTHDYLTGAYNRRRLDEYLDAVIEEARGAGKHLCAFLADVNDFKHINDEFGHAAGDQALVTVVQTIRSCLRHDDFLARYAGDEFVTVFPNCDENSLAEIIARIHESFETASAPIVPYRLSISIGGAGFDPRRHRDRETYVKELDSLMYEQKKSRHAAPRPDHG